MALPAVVLALLACITAVTAGIDQVRCIDAARLAARSLARGDSTSVATGLAGSAAPGAATVRVGGSADRVTVRVSSERSVAVLGLRWSVTASATAPREGVPP